MLEVDPIGLDSLDCQFLLAIIEKFQGGPVGIENLASAVGEESDTLQDMVEPYLIKEGFVQRTPRGRVATPRAYSISGSIRNIKIWGFYSMTTNISAYNLSERQTQLDLSVLPYDFEDNVKVLSEQARQTGTTSKILKLLHALTIKLKSPSQCTRLCFSDFFP